MEKHFQGDDSEFNDLLDELDREYQVYQAFVQNRDAMFALAAELKELTDFTDLEEKLEQFHDTINENVDMFIQISETILSRGDKEQAILEWMKFVKSNEQAQQAHMAALIGFDTPQKLDETMLPQRAWGYIKQRNLDTYDKYHLEDRDDLNDDEDWVTYGYKSRLEDRIGDILLRTPDEVAELFDEIEERQPAQENDQYAYIDAYTSHLPELAEKIKNEIQGVEFGPSERFMNAYYSGIENSVTFHAYWQKVKYIDNFLVNRSTKTRQKDRMQERSDHILHSPAFLDGLRFAMIVNARMLAPDGDTQNLQVLDLLDSHTYDLMNGIIQEIEESDDVDQVVLTHGLDLYDANLAHPEEPHAEEINRQYNPLNALAESVAADLYNIEFAGAAKDNFALQNAQDFYAGFGIGRTIYNAYRMDCIKQLEASFAA